MIMLYMTHINAKYHADRIESRSCLKSISRDHAERKELQDLLIFLLGRPLLALDPGAEGEDPSFGLTSSISNSTCGSRTDTLIKLTTFRNCHDDTEAGYATSFTAESRLFFMPTHS
jgi:hypothetical protein